MRATAHRREEVYNVKLAELLEQRGAVDAEAEQRHGSDMPDILFEWFGLSVVLEAKYEAAGAVTKLADQVQDRLAAGFGTLGIALLYPNDLKVATGNVGEVLEPAAMKVQLSTVGRTPGPWHPVEGVEGLVAVLDQARAVLIQDDELAASVELLSQSVDYLARAFAGQSGHAHEIVRIVTAADVKTHEISTDEEQAAFRVAALAVITATMLQMILCDRDRKVPKIVRTVQQQQRKGLVAGWQVILDHNYRAVFEIAHHVLNTMGDSDERLGAALVSMLGSAEQIVTKGVFGRHDLVGRIYHSLLTEQKFLATYYTSVPAATLLAMLVTDPSNWPSIDWVADPGDFEFKYADPSCGTGTLLAAVLGAVRRHYASARRKANKPVDGFEFGRRLIEDNIFGFDILAYAVQVCASTLLLSSPGTTVNQSQLYQLPFGGANGHLGSLDFLIGPAEGTLFGAWGDSVTVDGVAGRSIPISTPSVDLVIMNPPFTRTQGGSRLLGSLDPDEWPTARRNLDRLGKRSDVEGRVVAGLGALFVPLADRMIRNGGRIALVLPKTMLTGTQWDKTRKLLSTNYHIETVICSHEPDHWNFSDSTKLAEVLLIARKLNHGEEKNGYETRWVQLTRNPDNPIDALGVATALLRMGTPGAHGKAITVGAGLFANFGHAFSRPAPTNASPWRHATFASGDLDLTVDAMLQQAPIPLPRISAPISIPLRPLRELAVVGPDRARLHDGFVHASATTAYPCLWGHSMDDHLLSAAPNAWLTPSDKRTPDHARRYAAELWEGASPLMVAERLRLTTHRTPSLLLSERSLANTMWPVRLHEEHLECYSILCLWFNSTLGLLSWVGASEETEGPWLSMKKNKLLDLPILDMNALPAPARAELMRCWETVKSAELGPIAKSDIDPVRQAIDRAFASALALPMEGIDTLRSLFCAEPRLQRAERAKQMKEADDQITQQPLPLFG